jgi:hypothetical protein
MQASPNGIEQLLEHLRRTGSNAEFLAGIAKSMVDGKGR